MLKTFIFLLAAVLGASLAAPSPLSWWSIGLVKITKEDGTLIPFPCDIYGSTLTDDQSMLCTLDPYILSAAVRGLQRALSACNTLFGNDSFGNTCWNCTIYIDRFLLGQAVESTPNREREFMRFLMSASITYEIARACREKLIPDCHCAPSDIPFINKTKDKLIIAGCNVDIDWAAAYTMLIMNGNNDTLEEHNTAVGIRFANKTHLDIDCTGPLGSCSIEVHSLAPEPTVDVKNPHNVTTLRAVYELAVWVNLDGIGIQWPPNQVVFGSGSHDFCCSHNPSIGIPGTQGRECDPNPSQPNSCDRICCGRGYTCIAFTKVVKTYTLDGVKLVTLYKTIMVDSCYCK